MLRHKPWPPPPSPITHPLPPLRSLLHSLVCLIVRRRRKTDVKIENIEIQTVESFLWRSGLRG